MIEVEVAEMYQLLSALVEKCLGLILLGQYEVGWYQH